MTQKAPKPKHPKAKKARKRQLGITQAQKDRICREVAKGRSLRKVLKAKGLPAMSTVMEALQKERVFSEQYARARRLGIEHHIDELVDLADTATAENAHAVRLKVDVRKWLASKLVPKVYGDKVELTGAEGRDLIPAGDQRELAKAIAFIITTNGPSPEPASAPTPEPLQAVPLVPHQWETGIEYPPGEVIEGISKRVDETAEDPAAKRERELEEFRQGQMIEAECRLQAGVGGGRGGFPKVIVGGAPKLSTRSR